MLMPSSEQWQVNWGGKYPAKIYTIDGVLIYQVDDGTTNAGKAPSGGVLSQSSVASSMLETINNPLTHYYGSGAVINQDGHSGDLYNYYWTSYSRGTDGERNNTSWHNAYLDGYIPLRVKSIYDPCPYLYRLPSHGTYNQFELNPGWTMWSYLGGAIWNLNTLGESWFLGLGLRNGGLSVFDHTGYNGFYNSSTTSSQINRYLLAFISGKGIYSNHSYGRSYGLSVRCIDFATLALLLRTSA